MSNLAEDSKSYHQEADIYERFSQAEDAPGKILSFLRPLVLGKEILDLGCGTGKYVLSLAPLARSYCGLDISPEQLTIAQRKARGIPNLTWLCSSAETVALPDSCIDTVISTWVIGTIKGLDRKRSALSEANRVLKKKGTIYLVENDVGGEFEFIRGRYPHDTRTQEYNQWLEREQGFVPIRKFDTYFGFTTLAEAQSIIGAIWGPIAAQKVTKAEIEQKIVLYEKRK